MQTLAYATEKSFQRDTGRYATPASISSELKMIRALKKFWRRFFSKKIKTKPEERFESLYSKSTEVTPEWIKRHESNLVEVARREDTITDATIVLYRDRHGITLCCEYQNSGRKVRSK